MKSILIAFGILITSSLVVNAQQSDSAANKMNLSAGMQYISNQTYAGRTDSLSLPVLLPQFNFSVNGFFVHSKGYFNLSSGHQAFDGISLEPGYEFSANHWNGSISLIKYFISDSSNLIIAPVKSSLEFYIGNQNHVLNPFAGAEYVFTPDGNDLIAYGGLSKLMRLTHPEKEPSLTLEPTFSLTAGTQSFYYSFIKNYAAGGNGRGRGRNNTGSTTTQVTQQSKTFALMGTAVEIPIEITKGQLEGKITPAWEAPLNTGGSASLKSCVYVRAEVMFDF